MLTEENTTETEDDDEEEENTENKEETKCSNDKNRKRIRKNKELTILTINARGVKGKMKSIETIVDTEKPDLLLITETHLKGKERMNIKGHKWIGKNRQKKQGGGIGILISDKISRYVTEDCTGEEYEDTEILWIKIKTRPKNIAVGVFYGPQENQTVEKVEQIYENLENQIAQKRNQMEILIGGDFNAKLDIEHGEQRQQSSRNGKILKKLLENNEMHPMNIDCQHGLWTRVNRSKTDEKSVIDYIIATDYIKRNTNSIIVDEEGIIRPKGKNETDHNTIVMKMKINNTRKKTYQERWNTNNQKGWEAFNKEIQKENEKGKLQERDYKEIESTIKRILKNTIGKKKT